MAGKIAGVLPILHTPFDENDAIDFDSLASEIDWAFEVGADGVCTAMVSEILRLSDVERIQLNRQVVELAAGRGVVVASVGAESTRQAVEFANDAASAGCNAVMAIPPVTTPLDEEQLRSYFGAIAKCVDVPLIVQDASSYVGKSIPTSFYVQLLDEYGPEKILFKP